MGEAKGKSGWTSPSQWVTQSILRQPVFAQEEKMTTATKGEGSGSDVTQQMGLDKDPVLSRMIEPGGPGGRRGRGWDKAKAKAAGRGDGRRTKKASGSGQTQLTTQLTQPCEEEPSNREGGGAKWEASAHKSDSDQVSSGSSSPLVEETQKPSVYTAPTTLPPSTRQATEVPAGFTRPVTYRPKSPSPQHRPVRPDPKPSTPLPSPGAPPAPYPPPSPEPGRKGQKKQAQAIHKWFAFAVRVFTESLVEEAEGSVSIHRYNVSLNVPELLGTLAGLLQSLEGVGGTEAGRLASWHLAQIFRSKVFGSPGAFSTPAILRLLNNWTKSLGEAVELEYVRARRLLVHPQHAGTFSRPAIIYLRDLQAAVRMTAETAGEESEAVLGSLWDGGLSPESAPLRRPPRLFFALALKHADLAKERSINLVLASRLRLPIDHSKTTFGTPPGVPKSFAGFSGSHHLLVKSSVQWMTLRDRGFPDKGIPGLWLGLGSAREDWGVWSLPVLTPSFMVLVAGSPYHGRTIRNHYLGFLRTLTLSNIRKWITRLQAPADRAKNGSNGSREDMAALRLPNSSVWAEEPLDLSPGLKRAGLEEVLWDGQTGLGEVCPHGTLRAFLQLHLPQMERGETRGDPSELTFEWKSEAGVEADNGMETMGLHSTLFLILWDAERNLPVSLSRLGRPSPPGDPYPVPFSVQTRAPHKTAVAKASAADLEAGDGRQPSGTPSSTDSSASFSFSEHMDPHLKRRLRPKTCPACCSIQ